jgi:hypothetical protein
MRRKHYDLSHSEYKDKRRRLVYSQAAKARVMHLVYYQAIY